MTVLGDLPSPWGIAASLLDPPDPEPVKWAEDKLRVALWSRQRQIIESVRDNRRTAVKSCHDSGKSFVAAVTAANWLDEHLPGEAFVVSSAPTWPQVRAILWREIGKLHRRGNLVGRVNQTEWHIGNELVGYGRKPADTDESGFQGIHAPYVLVILDEACGIPTQLFDAADTLITNENSRILAIGNPDEASGQFAKLFEPGSGWNTITIKAWDTPNFTGEEVPAEVRDSLLSQVWVEEKRQTWTETSPLWISKVEAEFPRDNTDGVVPWSWVNKCRLVPMSQPEAVPVHLGVDVGAGGDLTVIRERRGPVAGHEWTSTSPDPEVVVGKVLVAIRETDATVVKVDTIGIGWAIAGWLKSQIREADDLRAKVKVVGVNVAEGAENPKRFFTKRDEMWWNTGRELSRQHGWDLSEMENAEDTVAQLVAPTYEVKNGKVKIEKKEDTIKRIGNSPDHADALLMAYYTPTKSKRPVGW